MFKSLLKKTPFYSTKKFFCSTKQVFLYPDKIINKLSKTLEEHGDLTEVESEIVEKINFFDVDQFVDTVSLLATENQGSEFLWDILSRKIYDYELDVAQSYILFEVLNLTLKHEIFMTDNLSRNNLVWDLKWPKAGKVFVEKLL
jgi:hypothetical protein